jgi:hypothetical protein
MEQELANYLYEEMIGAYPQGASVPADVEAENRKSFLAQATAIVKFLRVHGLV